MAGKGKLFIVSAPSGAGKTTLVREALKEFADLSYSVSHTTRPPRSNEREGLDYFFITPARFEEKITRGDWLEWARVHDHYYGTSRSFVEDCLQRGKSLLLDIDVQGAQRIKEEFPQAISIFVLPPSAEELRHRLKKRGTETDEQMQLRLHNAIKEMQTFSSLGFEYVVINKHIKTAVNQVLSIVEAHGCRIDKQKPEQLRKITG